MYIRKTKTGTNRDGSDKISYRLVHGIRVGGKVKQRTLLNLGRHFKIERSQWKLLTQRVDELLWGQSHFDFKTVPADVEAEARRISARLISSKSVETTNSELTSPRRSTKTNIQSVDVNSVRDVDGRTIGVEHAALVALEWLEMSKILTECGLNRRQRLCALASIAARIVAPASENATYEWLKDTSALGEMLGIDFGALNRMSLYRASDSLLANQDRIEQHLFAKAQDLFGFTQSIAFYDLTNTHFEGQALEMDKARRGRSKQKRHDSPLLTLAVVVDASGFVMKSQVFSGNVAECRTLKHMIEKLGANSDATVVMDRGVADAANLKWLRDNGYHYVVVSRDHKREFESDNVKTITTSGGGTVSFYQHQALQQNEDGSQYQEVYLRCHSKERAEKENSMVAGFTERFEKALNQLNDGLSRPRTRKKPDDVERRIGRLQKQHSRISRHYKVRVHTDETGTKAVRITWQFDPVEGTMVTHPGVYCLRSSQLDWDAVTMWQVYVTLTEVESVFRSLKSELGLRPVYHQKQHRADGHLFITVLAYQVVRVLRTKMKANGCHYSWTTVRRILGNINRTTTTFNQPGDRTLHVRKTADPDAVQSYIYDAMGIDAPARNVQTTII